MATVELYDTQIGFLDRVVESGAHGRTREEAIRGVLLEHVRDRLAGAGTYVGGTVRADVLESPLPEYGPRRLEVTLEPVTGKAVPVYRGEVFRIEQEVGGTCVDIHLDERSAREADVLDSRDRRHVRARHRRAPL